MGGQKVRTTMHSPLNRLHDFLFQHTSQKQTANSPPKSFHPTPFSNYSQTETGRKKEEEKKKHKKTSWGGGEWAKK